MQFRYQAQQCVRLLEVLSSSSRRGRACTRGPPCSTGSAQRKIYTTAGVYEGECRLQVLCALEQGFRADVHAIRMVNSVD